MPANHTALSVYNGIKVTITQAPGDRPAVVTVAVKQREDHWDDWNLLYPAIRVPLRDIKGHRDVLRTIVDVVEELIRVDDEYA